MELKDLLSMIDTRAELLLEELGLAQPRAANEREWSDAPRADHSGEGATRDRQKRSG